MNKYDEKLKNAKIPVKDLEKALAFPTKKKGTAVKKSAKKTTKK